jgi:hypothetical protein
MKVTSILYKAQKMGKNAFFWGEIGGNALFAE